MIELPLPSDEQSRYKVTCNNHILCCVVAACAQQHLLITFFFLLIGLDVHLFYFKQAVPFRGPHAARPPGLD